MIGGSNTLHSVKETAAFLGVSEDTLYRNWRKWGMTAYTLGRNIKFRGRDIEAWLERNKAE